MIGARHQQRMLGLGVTWQRSARAHQAGLEGEAAHGRRPADTRGVRPSPMPHVSARACARTSSASTRWRTRSSASGAAWCWSATTSGSLTRRAARPRAGRRGPDPCAQLWSAGWPAAVPAVARQLAACGLWWRPRAAGGRRGGETRVGQGSEGGRACAAGGRGDLGVRQEDHHHLEGRHPRLQAEAGQGRRAVSSRAGSRRHPSGLQRGS